VAEQAAGELLSLPMFPHMTDSQVGSVCEELNDILQGGTVSPELINVR
jgi:dTDP-4-amino-4,6-dideoxygalactose transaminase